MISLTTNIKYKHYIFASNHKIYHETLALIIYCKNQLETLRLHLTLRTYYITKALKYKLEI